MPDLAEKPTTESTGAKPACGPRCSRGSVRTLPPTGVVLVGSARAGRMLSALVEALDGQTVIAGWVDVAPRAEGDGVPGAVRLGSIEDLPLLTARYGLRCALVCGEAGVVARARRMADLVGLEIRAVPGAEELLGPEAMVSVASAGGPRLGESGFPGGRPLDLGLLIGRTPHALDRTAVSRVLAGKRVLITGAGGSIGSELARVAAGFEPEQIILMERSENALFEIDRLIHQRHPGLGRRAVLHDVTDPEGTRRLLADLRPQVVFHAAAHKHVPLMEDHPGHAVTNNLFGTKSIADAAIACGAERFVMISSDKAVNPTSVMGASKRLAELYVRGLSRVAEGRTRLSLVRFGNVLGSACSVLTIWSSQIAEGGPVTITDPRMTRYFMTIPEAATLVVQSTTVPDAGSDQGADGGAGAAGGGEGRGVGVFVLDMGEPIRIVDLACRFVRAHGLWPVGEGLPPPPEAGVPTLPVVFTGARPGEKLHEELAYAAELLRPTAHPGVRTWAGPGFGADEEGRVGAMVAELGAARFSRDPRIIIDAMRRYVPEFRPRTE